MDPVPYYLTGHVEHLVEAIVRAEGGEDHFLTAVRCSKPYCSSYAEAISICCKTIRSRILAFGEWQLQPLYDIRRHKGPDPWTGEDNPRYLIFSEKFIQFLGEKWAPVGADNDPQSLNHHWVPNVLSIYHQLLEENDGDNGTESAGSRGVGGVTGTVLPGSR